MTAYTLSVVLLIPAAHRDLINAYAASLGWGPDNLSVELKHADGSTWYGCHTWAAPEFLSDLSNPPSTDDETDYTPALAAMVTSIVAGGNALENWSAALAANSLTPVVVGEVLP